MEFKVIKKEIDLETEKSIYKANITQIINGQPIPIIFDEENKIYIANGFFTIEELKAIILNIEEFLERSKNESK